MGIWDFLTGKKSKLAQIAKMTAGDLEKEQLRIEARQDAIMAKVKTLEGRKSGILKDGAGKASDLERKAMAVRYKQVDSESSDYVAQASLLSKQIRIVGRLQQIKRREELLKQEGFWSTISDVDTGELEQFMIDIRAKALQGDREASRILEILDEPLAAPEETDENDILEIVAAMEAIGQSEPTDEVVEEAKKKISQAESESDEA